MSKEKNKERNKQEQEEEEKDLRIEILEKVSGLATAGFGLVAALAWNDAIKAFFNHFFPKPEDNFLALTVYALIITILVVIITVQLGRMVNLAKKQLKKVKKG